MLTAESLEIMLALTAESLESISVLQEREPLLPQSIELDAGLEKQVESMVSRATVDGADPDLVAAQNKACLKVIVFHSTMMYSVDASFDIQTMSVLFIGAGVEGCSRPKASWWRC